MICGLTLHDVWCYASCHSFKLCFAVILHHFISAPLSGFMYNWSTKTIVRVYRSKDGHTWCWFGELTCTVWDQCLSWIKATVSNESVCPFLQSIDFTHQRLIFTRYRNLCCFFKSGSSKASIFTGRSDISKVWWGSFRYTGKALWRRRQSHC